MPMINEAFAALMEGLASAEDIDKCRSGLVGAQNRARRVPLLISAAYCGACPPDAVGAGTRRLRWARVCQRRFAAFKRCR